MLSALLRTAEPRGGGCGDPRGCGCSWAPDRPRRRLCSGVPCGGGGCPWGGCLWAQVWGGEGTLEVPRGRGLSAPGAFAARSSTWAPGGPRCGRLGLLVSVAGDPLCSLRRPPRARDRPRVRPMVVRLGRALPVASAPTEQAPRGHLPSVPCLDTWPVCGSIPALSRQPRPPPPPSAGRERARGPLRLRSPRDPPTSPGKARPGARASPASTS